MKNKLFGWTLVLVVALPLCSSQLARHPFFQSTTEIQHNAKEKTLEMSCRIFTDDFESTLRLNYRSKIDLVNPPDKPAMDKLVASYVSEHVRITVDGKPLKWQFVGYEKEEENIVSYFEVPNVDSISKVEVNNDLLYEYKREQVNLVHVIVNGNRKSAKLENPRFKATFAF